MFFVTSSPCSHHLGFLRADSNYFTDVLSLTSLAIIDDSQRGTSDHARTARCSSGVKQVLSTATLQILSRRNCFGDIRQLALISEATAQAVLHKFWGHLAAELHDEHIRLPTGATEEKALNEYDRLGFTGAIGSTDVARMRWGLCEHSIAWMWALRPVTMETRCFHKKLKFQRHTPKYFCTARYEHKSSKKDVSNFSKTPK